MPYIYSRVASPADSQFAGYHCTPASPREALGAWRQPRAGRAAPHPISLAGGQAHQRERRDRVGHAQQRGRRVCVGHEQVHGEDVRVGRRRGGQVVEARGRGELEPNAPLRAGKDEGGLATRHLRAAGSSAAACGSSMCPMHVHQLGSAACCTDPARPTAGLETRPAALTARSTCVAGVGRLHGAPRGAGLRPRIEGRPGRTGRLFGTKPALSGGCALGIR